MNHVAFAVPPERIDEYRDRLRAAGVDCTDVANHDDSEWGISDDLHPGVFIRSIYFQDPDGILLEFACWTRALTTGGRRPPTGPGRRPGDGLSPAVPRLRQVPKAEAEAPIVQVMYEHLFEGRDPVAEPGTATGSPGDWWTVFALVPDVLEHAVQGFGLYQSPQRRLDPTLRELAQARAGWAAGSQFVFSQHCKSLRAQGVDETMIEAIPHWAAAPCYDETQRLVLAYTDCLVLDRGRVPDGLFAALQRPAGGRGDPRADLHRRPLPPARGDVAGAAHRVRRPSRAGGRGGRQRS